MSSGSKRTRKYGSRTKALDTVPNVELTGKTMLITGTTSGIGIETARSLALLGAHIVMANRNLVESEALKEKILKEKPDAKIDLLSCDLSSLQSVKAAADEYKQKQWPIHALVLNAGVFQPIQKTTLDGYDSSFGVNHLGHFYLIRELLPVVRQSAPARIVIVSSHSHNHTGISATDPTEVKVKRLIQMGDTNEFGYRLYAYSKLCNVLTGFRLHRKENANNISVYVLHPGTMIGTNISRGYGFWGKAMNVLSKPFTKDLSQGAATTVYCAASPEIANVSGKYWESCWDDEKQLQVNLARDEEFQDAFWDKSEELIFKFESTRRPAQS
ncbi:unnamed protein product, partial [Mesorhabditis belari]|uniref:Uncharacterized protein n=1 Tax=Mesorhabditis belari TaxID=2138241 RepID=A0AAF3EFD5_9BILA